MANTTPRYIAFSLRIVQFVLARWISSHCYRKRKFVYSFDLVKAKVDRIVPLTGREEKNVEYFEVSPDSNTIAFVGSGGYILVVSSKIKELVGTTKMNGTARSLALADDGTRLLSSGGDGHVYHWDLRTSKCFHKPVEESCIKGSVLCASPDGNLFAADSCSVVVNIYNTKPSWWREKTNRDY